MPAHPHASGTAGQSVWAAGPHVQVHWVALKPLEGQMGSVLAPRPKLDQRRVLWCSFLVFQSHSKGSLSISKCPLHTLSLC